MELQVGGEDIRKGLKKLGMKHKDMAFDHVYGGLSNVELAEKYGVSACYVSQVINSSLMKIEISRLIDRKRAEEMSSLKNEFEKALSLLNEDMNMTCLTAKDRLIRQKAYLAVINLRAIPKKDELSVRKNVDILKDMLDFLAEKDTDEKNMFVDGIENDEIDEELASLIKGDKPQC